MGNVNNKIQQCMKKLAIWNKERLKGSLKGAISKIEKEIVGLQSSVSQERDVLLISKEEELDKLLEEEEIYWRRRSREEWLSWGDKNTK